MSKSKNPHEALDANINKLMGLFPQGSRFERHGNLLLVYDPTGTRRWQIQENIIDQQRTRRLALEAQTRCGTWHRLMGAVQVGSAITDETTNMGIVVEVISSWANPTSDHTPSTKMFYSYRTGNVLHRGAGGGYSSRKNDVEEDLRNAGALARIESELPPHIDVNATVNNILQSFRNGRFETPQFALPRSQKQLEKGSPHMSPGRSLLRWFGRK